MVNGRSDKDNDSSYSIMRTFLCTCAWAETETRACLHLKIGKIEVLAEGGYRVTCKYL